MTCCWWCTRPCLKLGPLNGLPVSALLSASTVARSSSSAAAGRTDSYVDVEPDRQIFSQQGRVLAFLCSLFFFFLKMIFLLSFSGWLLLVVVCVWVCVFHFFFRVVRVPDVWHQSVSTLCPFILSVGRSVVVVTVDLSIIFRISWNASKVICLPACAFTGDGMKMVGAHAVYTKRTTRTKFNGRGGGGGGGIKIKMEKKKKSDGFGCRWLSNLTYWDFRWVELDSNIEENNKEKPLCWSVCTRCRPDGFRPDRSQQITRNYHK